LFVEGLYLNLLQKPGLRLVCSLGGVGSGGWGFMFKYFLSYRM